MRDLGLSICCLLFILGAASARPEEVTYPSSLEGVDVDDVLGNERLLKQYFKCVIGEKPCTPQGKKLKELLPHAIESECEKCTQEQKDMAMKVCSFLIQHHSDMWTRLEKKFDPTGKYKAKICQKLKGDEVDTKGACK